VRWGAEKLNAEIKEKMGKKIENGKLK